jgi:2-iminobutanoate/2-iminopropanoate deaminase
MHAIATAQAPAAIGPYSQALTAGGLVFCSGQIALDPVTMQVRGVTTAEQTDQVLRNLEAVLTAAGSGLHRVLKTTVFLRRMDDFQAMNEVYARHFGAHRPARSTVEVSRLPRDVSVEIECVAATSDAFEG